MIIPTLVDCASIGYWDEWGKRPRLETGVSRKEDILIDEWHVVMRKVSSMRKC